MSAASLRSRASSSTRSSTRTGSSPCTRMWRIGGPGKRGRMAGDPRAQADPMAEVGPRIARGPQRRARPGAENASDGRLRARHRSSTAGCSRGCITWWLACGPIWTAISSPPPAGRSPGLSTRTSPTGTCGAAGRATGARREPPTPRRRLPHPAPRPSHGEPADGSGGALHRGLAAPGPDRRQRPSVHPARSGRGVPGRWVGAGDGRCAPTRHAGAGRCANRPG